MIGYDRGRGQLFVDRTRSGKVDFHPGFAAVHSAEMLPVKGRVCIRIFVDRSSVEVFGNSGQATITDSIFPSASSQGIGLFASGGPVLLRRLDLYKMKAAW